MIAYILQKQNIFSVKSISNTSTEMAINTITAVNSNICCRTLRVFEHVKHSLIDNGLPVIVRI